LDGAVVHLHREVDGQLSTRLPEDTAESRIEIQALRREVELLLGDLPRVDRRGDVLDRHDVRWSSVAVSPSDDGRRGLGRLPDDPTGRRSRRGRSARHEPRWSIPAGLIRMPSMSTVPQRYGNPLATFTGTRV